MNVHAGCIANGSTKITLLHRLRGSDSIRSGPQPGAPCILGATPAPEGTIWRRTCIFSFFGTNGAH